MASGVLVSPGGTAASHSAATGGEGMNSLWTAGMPAKGFSRVTVLAGFALAMRSRQVFGRAVVSDGARTVEMVRLSGAKSHRRDGLAGGVAREEMVPRAGIEPATLRFSVASDR
jgi:hypothetical protein